MKQVEFEHLHRQDWQLFADWLANKRKAKAEPTTATFTPELLPEKYRQLCQQLSIAKDRHYSTALIDELHLLVEGGHQALYGGLRETSGSVLSFLKDHIPQTVRREARFCLTAGLLFFVPLFGILVLLQYQPDFVLYLLNHETIMEMESMYKPGSEITGFARAADSDFLMWGYYIWNNVRIDFQCFATGILFGLGSLFYVLYNGITIGAVAGHLTHLGYNTPFWSFVAGHSGPELTGVVLSGAAGLKLGFALIAPGRLRRADALKLAAKPAATLIVGAAILTFLAAFLEAFWSSQIWVAPWVKYVVGGLIWLLVWAWLLRGGKQRAN